MILKSILGWSSFGHLLSFRAIILATVHLFNELITRRFNDKILTIY
jgi:hypothetical protein